MKIEQRKWTRTQGWSPESAGDLAKCAQMVLMFGSTTILKEENLCAQVRQAYPNAHILGCSTAGEICGTQVLDGTLVATAVYFEHTRLKGSKIGLNEVGDSFQAGEALAGRLDDDELVHVLALSDGLAVNGSDLVKGLERMLPEKVTVTGGLAGDGSRFQETLVFLDGPPETGVVAGLGFYGNRLKVGCGSLGGWDPFGPERLITRSKGNVLFELDGQSALELYKRYLGEHSGGLPATGLLFPLSVRTGAGATGVVRTILSVNEEDQSMTFAGDTPQGSYARLMKANSDRLIDGATGAAKAGFAAVGSRSPSLAVLISCVGRKLVLKQRVEEEVESVRQILGDATILTGFYSYGEIAPFLPGVRCELHNQTMTITTFSEE